MTERPMVDFVRHLPHLAAFKLYHILGVILFFAASTRTAQAFGGPASPLNRSLIPLILAAAVVWLVVTWVLRPTPSEHFEPEIKNDPLTWSPAATKGTILFFTLIVLLGASTILNPSPFTPVLLALAGVSATTAGVSTHLRVYWEARRETPNRHTDAHKAEHQVWAAVFAGTAAWTSLLISGGLLVLALGALNPSVRPSFPPSMTPSQVLQVLVLNGLCVGYTIAATILWLLRPLHRRIEQLSDAYTL